MERNREARRGSMATTNSGLLRRRQQRKEDTVMELRDRDRKKDRDRDRKKRREDRSMHGDDTSDESLEEEDVCNEDEDATTNHRFSAIPPPLNHKNLVSKPARPQTQSWKVVDEMIGVPIPRKARSSSLKRSHDSAGGGSGELIHRQASSSPARKKKLVSETKQRPPKIAKSSSIEMEVAEVLFGMNRHIPAARQDSNVFSNEAKSEPLELVSTTPLVATVPKRKRPRLKLDEESATSPAAKMDMELPAKPEESSASASPSISEKKFTEASVENGGTAGSTKIGARMENNDAVVEQKELDANIGEVTEKKAVVEKVECPREEKFSIDLMAPPCQGNSEKDNDGSLDHAEEHESLESSKEKVQKLVIGNGETENSHKFTIQDAKKDASAKEKLEVVGLGLGVVSNKHEELRDPQSKIQKIDPKQERRAHPASLPFTAPVSGWPGGFPQFGYMGQASPLPAVIPMDVSSATPKTLQPPHLFPPQKPKRCATHCYVAKMIQYNQQISRLSPFWPPAAAAAVGSAPIYGASTHNLIPTSEAATLGRSMPPLQNKASPAIAMTYAGPPAKEKTLATAAANGALVEAQRKQFMLQQTPQPGSAAPPSNMLHGPAFIFPIGQQSAPAATAAPRLAAAKSSPMTGNAAPIPSSASSAVASSGPSGHVTTMNFSYAGLQPNDAQYLAILQNNGYPFPIPASQYRGANPTQAMPFLNGSLYPSPMLHPSSQQQLRPQQQQPPPTHQHTSTSSGSSSSQKHHSQQSHHVPGASAAAPPTVKQHLQLLPPQARQLDSEAACEDSPSTADSTRASQAQKSMYGNYAMSMHPQNFALITPAASANPSSGNHNEKPQSQAYALSFAPFSMPAAAAGASAPGLDFTSMVQNHALFHSLPESARHHGYQQVAAASVATAQHKKPHNEDSTSKAQHSLSFTRQESDAQISTEGTPRTLNLMQSPANGGHGVRTSNRPSSAAPASGSVSAIASNTALSALHKQPTPQEQDHQQIVRLQQQHFKMQQQMSAPPTKSSSNSTSNATPYPDRMQSGSPMSRFPQGAGFPPSIMQGASASQSSQWKASVRAATPGSANSAMSSSLSAKNQFPQQQQMQHQARNLQQHQQVLQMSTNPHQTHISFGSVSSSKPVAASVQNSSLTSAPPVAKNNGNGSPRASQSPKTGPPPPSLLSPTMSGPKNSPSSSSSNLKSAVANNRNMTSILGHPQNTPTPNSSSSKLPPQTQQQQQKQFPQHQLFFSNQYIQAQQSAQSNVAAAAANFYQQQQRRQSEQHLQQQNSSVTSDPAKAAAASGVIKGPAPAQHNAQFVFPYISAKSAPDQKAAPGNENLQRKPEKR